MPQEDLEKLVEHWKQQYRHALAEKASMAARLEEALGLLDIKDEHIALLEEKARLTGDLQSQLAGCSAEADSLRYKLAEGSEKLNRSNVLKNELEEELVASANLEKNYYSLKDTNTHVHNELLMLREELKELTDLNKDLLKELEKMSLVQMQLQLLQQENDELQKKQLR